MFSIFLISLILPPSSSAPVSLSPEPSYKTCGEALDRRLTRVCQTGPQANTSPTSPNDEQTFTNYTDPGSVDRNATVDWPGLSADCCFRTNGCSDGWIRQRYCVPTSRTKRAGSELGVWNQVSLHNQAEYDCFQASAYYYNWWDDAEAAIIEKLHSNSPLLCQELCEENQRCKSFSFTQFERGGFTSCLLRNQVGGGDMRFLMSVSGPRDCNEQESFVDKVQGPIDTCIELANSNSDFLRKPRKYTLPNMIPFNPRFSDPKQFNVLQIKLKVKSKFTLYLAPKVSEDYSDPVISENPDVKKMFKNAYTIDSRLDDYSPTIVVNHMTDEDWSDEEVTKPIFGKPVVDEILIHFLPTKIMTYIHVRKVDGKKRILEAELSKPAWMDSVENIWFNGDGDTSVFNFFHCTSGMAVDQELTEIFQLNFNPRFGVGPANMSGNYVAFYGIVYGSTEGQFQIEFLASGAPNFDTALTFSVRFWKNDEHIVFNSKVNGDYGVEERFDDFPFYGINYKNDLVNFTRLDFTFLANRINVAINGISYHSFSYRYYQRVNVVGVRTARTVTSDKHEAEPDSPIYFQIYGVDVKWIDYNT